MSAVASRFIPVCNLSRPRIIARATVAKVHYPLILGDLHCLLAHSLVRQSHLKLTDTAAQLQYFYSTVRTGDPHLACTLASNYSITSASENLVPEAFRSFGRTERNLAANSGHLLVQIPLSVGRLQNTVNTPDRQGFAEHNRCGTSTAAPISPTSCDPTSTSLSRPWNLTAFQLPTFALNDTARLGRIDLPPP